MADPNPGTQHRPWPDATEIADRVRAGSLSPVQVIDEHLDRLAKANPALTAVVAVREDAARAEAVDLESRIAQGFAAGPLAGVPFTVKDVLATADLPTTCGSRAVGAIRTTLDATAVGRLRAAGAILVGKTNCPEFALGIDTVNEMYGRTYNPLGRFTPGGSSGGESAAVAAGMSAIGLGSDYGGSIRWPAQCTALVGLRPTVGRVPGTGHLPCAGSLEPFVPNPLTLEGQVKVIGPLAASVRDAHAALAAICGADGIDPAAVPVPLRDPAAVPITDIEIRWGSRIAGMDADPTVDEGVAHAVDVLARAGIRVTEGLPDAVSAAADVYSEIRAADPLVEISEAAAGREHLLGSGIAALLERRRPASAGRLAQLWTARGRLLADLTGWLHGDRLLALPVAITPPYDPTQELPLVAGRRYGEFDLVTPCRVISLFGLPAISVPCGRTPTGLPLSVQLVAPAFREDLLLAVAVLVERERPGG